MYMYIYIHIHIYIYVSTYICVYTHMCEKLVISIYIYIYLHVYTYLFIPRHLYISVRSGSSREDAKRQFAERIAADAMARTAERARKAGVVLPKRAYRKLKANLKQPAVKKPKKSKKPNKKEKYQDPN